MKYFENFPIITYANNLVRNIVSRSALTDATKKNGDIYYPHVVQEGDRVDVLSDLYYDDPAYSWLVWMTNDMVDPYYDYPMDEYNFKRYIIRKYGSVEIAQKYIKHYKTNGETDSTSLTVAQYDALNSDYKKYYEPVPGYNQSTNGYQRSKEEKTLSTNKIVAIEISSPSGFFRFGEQVAIDGNNHGIAMSANSTYLTVQHVVGEFTAASTITGDYSNTTATVVSATETANTLAATESSFWQSVSYYDYESDLNEKRKSIKLMDNKYAGQAQRELKRTMSM